MTGVSSLVCFVLPSPPSADAGWTVLGAGGCVQFAGVGGGGGAVGEMMTIYCVTLQHQAALREWEAGIKECYYSLLL